jgi:hypothetical protein
MVAGATGKSIPGRKVDDRELQRLQEKDYWLQITRAKLLMDLIFVCQCHVYSVWLLVLNCLVSLRRLQAQPGETICAVICWPCFCHS